MYPTQLTTQPRRAASDSEARPAGGVSCPDTSQMYGETGWGRHSKPRGLSALLAGAHCSCLSSRGPGGSFLAG